MTNTPRTLVVAFDGLIADTHAARTLAVVDALAAEGTPTDAVYVASSASQVSTLRTRTRLTFGSSRKATISSSPIRLFFTRVVPSLRVTSCNSARPNIFVSRYARLLAVSGSTFSIHTPNVVPQSS